ncbi:NAD(P)-dependent oxidoreductase [Pseudorhodoferax sp. LjRoot39]|uniref:NAD(P)-dependent oxidoreductase n=1 Tax=Pseudorhodoferax sp. LjRoot39 TaxID=3342328 RepID=UPI003ECF4A0C
MPAERPLVLLTNPIDAAVATGLQPQFELRLAPATDAATLCAAARDASYIVVRAALPPALFDNAPRLRAVVRHGAGLDMIPVGLASHHGVAVANVPAANAQSVAEYAVAQMLALARRLPAIDAALHRDGWPAARALADGACELQGKTLVVVGLGAIGQALARICTLGFGMQAIGVRRTPRPGGEIREMALDDALPLADHLVLACPLTPETRGLLDARRLGLLKPGARLVNVARGPVIDEAALLDALHSGRLAGAALDVFSTQPLPPASPLLQLPQVLATPHLAGLTDEAMARMSRGVADQLLQMLQGQLPRHCVNPEAREAILARWSTLNRDNP